MNDLTRSTLIGATTGGRSVTGLAALVVTTPAGARTQPDKAFTNGWVKVVATVLASQEYVIDKLPNTPSRLEPAGLTSRATAAAIGGVLVARRSSPSATRQHVALCAGLSTAAALGTSWLGARWRGWAPSRICSSFGAAVIEDAATLATGYAATRA
jgi:uncharacterized membrane protein